jgi:hypothetical protein
LDEKLFEGRRRRRRRRRRRKRRRRRIYSYSGTVTFGPRTV